MLTCSVVVATRDREEDCLRLVASLKLQTVHPRSLIVVDGGSAASALCGRIAAALEGTPIELIYERSEPGLTRQRNIALRRLATTVDIVFFFDDDVVLVDGCYLESLLRRYEADERQEIGGIFGRVLTPARQESARPGAAQSVVSRLVRAAQTVFLLASRKAYDVTAAGMNVPDDGSAAVDAFVSWQPGCNMSFRTSVLATHRFDEILRGYSMREDLDLSYRVSRQYLILYVPSVSVLHAQSPHQRLQDRTFGETDVDSWYWFVRKNLPAPVNRLAFWWALVGYLTILGVSGAVLGKRQARERFKGGVQAAVRLVRSRGKRVRFDHG